MHHKQQQTTPENLRDVILKKLKAQHTTFTNTLVNTLQPQIQDRILNVSCQVNILAAKAVLRTLKPD